MLLQQLFVILDAFRAEAGMRQFDIFGFDYFQNPTLSTC